MKLRKLEMKDAPLMLEWMHDENVVHDLNADFKNKNVLDCEKFILHSQLCGENINYAIVDETDQYMGTVSLKHIHKEFASAEFAISVRSSAMGKGYSLFGMREIINIGIKKLNLDYIYWCVSKGNTRAIRFYEKNGYLRTKDVPEHILNHYTSAGAQKLLWYAVGKIKLD